DYYCCSYTISTTWVF
nr:immunoglobulin light chain junction region [Macaca mulatta]MOV74140.1 immunoglobulin light chain junction region [Macaca mulatta]